MAEIARASMQAMAAARAKSTQSFRPRLGRPIMKQPTFNWEAEDKYNELKNFRLGVNNITKSYLNCSTSLYFQQTQLRKDNTP